MRVLIIRNAYQKDAGGAEQFALNLAIALTAAGHAPILVTNVEKIHAKSKQAGIKAIKGPWNKKQGWDRLYYFRFPLFTAWYIFTILKYRVAVVHPQGRDDFVFATNAAKTLRRKIVWTDHADLKYALDSIKHPNPRMRRWLIRAAKNTTSVICASHNEMAEIELVAPELDNLIVVHNGVFQPQKVEPVNKTNKFVVGTNARLVPTKGIGELIEGFAKLNRKEVDLWLLGGTSGNLNIYEALCKKLGVEKNVKFWDYVDRPDNVVASMDIFVHASYHEAFSLAIIEAAMLGKPIVATNVGGTPEIIDNGCGILISPKDPSAITSSLTLLLDNPAQRKEISKKVQSKAKREFDFQKNSREQNISYI